MVKIGLIGASGLVGSTILQILETQGFAIDEITLLASARSAGTEVPFKGEILVIRELTKEVTKEPFDYILMAAGGVISKEYSPLF